MSDPTPPAVSEAIREAVARPSLFEQLREAAQQEAAAHRLFTDMRHGPHYEAMKPENTLSWKAASEIARLTGELADAKSWANGYRVNRELLLKRTGELHSEIARLTGEREAEIETKAREVVSVGLPENAKWLLASKDLWHDRARAAEAETARLRAALDGAICAMHSYPRREQFAAGFRDQPSDTQRPADAYRAGVLARAALTSQEQADV